MAVREVTWREVPVLRRLLFGRFGGGRLDPDQPILDGFVDNGSYVVLHDGLDEVVIGLRLRRASGRFTSDSTETRWEARPRHGEATIVLNFAAYDGTLSTQTRVDAGSWSTRLALYGYWAVIRAPSGLIRRRWLAAIARRAAAMGCR